MVASSSSSEHPYLDPALRAREHMHQDRFFILLVISSKLWVEILLPLISIIAGDLLIASSN